MSAFFNAAEILACYHLSICGGFLSMFVKVGY